MFFMVIKKIINNKWLFICLIIGSILTVAMVSSIPMYTEGVLQRMMTKTLENHQVLNNEYPGKYQAKVKFYSNYKEEDRGKAYTLFSRKLENSFIKELNIPLITQVENISIDYLEAALNDKTTSESKHTVSIEMLSDIEKHIKICHGRVFNNTVENGVYEAIVTQSTLKNMNINLEDEYLVKDTDNRNNKTYKVKVVGVFDVKDKNDIYWHQDLKKYNNSFIIDQNLFKNQFIDSGGILLTRAQWFYALDYYKMNLNDVLRLSNIYDKQVRWFNKFSGINFEMPCIEILKQFITKQKSLKVMLWVFEVPILTLLLFYMFMVSQLIVDNDKNEIAVFKSRGCSRVQIFLTYLFESTLLAFISIIAGPILGLLLCKVLGAANGFMEFVGRKSLITNINIKTYKYAMCAVIVSMVTMLIPSIFASKISIVEHKHNLVRRKKIPFWQRYFIDIVLLGISYYGYKSYTAKQSNFDVDPLLFIVSTLFVLGLGLFMLRLYPYLITIIFKLGKKKWSPVMYTSFIQVSRAGGQDKFLMLFLIFTISIGIFDANAARTLNKNTEEKIMYQNGADIVIEPEWLGKSVEYKGKEKQSKGQGNILLDYGNDKPAVYQEPPYKMYSEIEGVKSATKVFNKEQVIITTATGESITNANVMGIKPDEFGKTAWFRSDLLEPYHWYQYLNLLSQNMKGVLVSESLKDYVKLGDGLVLNWDDQQPIEVYVYGFIKYWPSFNPNPEKEGGKAPLLIVANLPYIQNRHTLEPYNIWIKKEAGVRSKTIYEDIKQKGLKIKSLKDSGQELIVKKNDPMLQSTNGALTLGFIITLIVSFIGFLIYWLLSINKRVLQFGIIRAMGMSVKNIIGILVSEQILISGVAIIMGIFVGKLTSKFFVPLIQITNVAVSQVPPFRVISYGKDMGKIYIFTGSMLIIGIIILSVIISKIKIHQAIKLGEE